MFEKPQKRLNVALATWLTKSKDFVNKEPVCGARRKLPFVCLLPTSAQLCVLALSSAGGARYSIPSDWVCPVCGLDKDAFTEE